MTKLQNLLNALLPVSNALELIELPDGKCKIGRVSPMTNTLNWMTLAVSRSQIVAYCDGSDARLIQEIFPNLSKSEREFIKTGYTDADWAAMSKGEDED